MKCIEYPRALNALRTVDDGPYQLMGTVQQEIADGSGGLVFRVPVSESDAPQRNIVITVEPSGDLAQPRGPVVIQTP